MWKNDSMIRYEDCVKDAQEALRNALELLEGGEPDRAYEQIKKARALVKVARSLSRIKED